MCFSNNYFIWSGSVDPVAHGTGTVGIEGGFALGRVGLSVLEGTVATLGARLLSVFL